MRQTQPTGTIYKLKANTVGMTVDARPSIDRNRMSARACINTAAIDRDAEQILPMGVQTDNYRKNPVVLWGHGLEPLLSFPIAKCEHPNGELALTKTEEAIVADAYFTNRLKESEQVFALIDEGIVRGASIHVDPIKNSLRRHNGHTYREISESDLLEWSWGGIPVNPECVRKLLSTNRISGSSLSDSIRRSLMPYASPRHAMGIGWRRKNMSYDEQSLQGMTDDELVAARGNSVDEDEAAMVSKEMARRLRAKADELD